MRLTNDGVFRTIQGEGPEAGRPAIFVRLSGCNMRCAWAKGDGSELAICDTPYSSFTPETVRKSVDEIVDLVLEASRQGETLRNVVITGGEPFLQNLQELTNELLARRFRVSIETNGSLFAGLDSRVRLVISPKLKTLVNHQPGSTVVESDKYKEVIASFLKNRNKVALKFVASQKEHLKEIEYFLKAFPSKDKVSVYVMPEGATADELARNAPLVWLFCKEKGFFYTDRLHVRLFNGARSV